MSLPIVHVEVETFHCDQDPGGADFDRRVKFKASIYLE